MARKRAPRPPDPRASSGDAIGRVRRASIDRRAIFLEAHHRVQNQLQLVITLLGRAPATQTDPSLSAVLQDLQDRVAAIGAINQLLTDRFSDPTVDFAALLRELCRSFNDAFGKIGIVELELDAAPCRLDFETANRAALILHEVLLNAFKHAFPPDGRGRATVRLRRDGAACVLTIRDNGPGIRRDTHAGVGTRLLTTLIAQSRGSIERNSSSTGTTVTLVFPSERNT